MTPQLDRNAQAVLEVIAASGKPHLSTLSVQEARRRVRAVLVTKGPVRELHSVRDVALPTPSGSRRLRLYRDAPGTLPIALFLHGGGWTVNDIDTHDDLCRRLAQRSGWLLASLDYRKAPEHRYPAQLEDAYVAYRWLVDNAPSLGGDPSRRALVGESSGAAIAASLAVLLRDTQGPMPLHQVLAYPVTDAFDRWPSYAEHGTGYILDRALLAWYFAHYWPDGDEADHPYLVPLATPDLSGLPSTLVITAEFDPLRDEGVEYARRLAQAGVAVDHVHASDQMHGFLLLSRAVPSAAALVARIADSLRDARLT